MKEFKLYDIEYTITTCTAIAECDERNEAARQNALLVITTLESGETVEHIVFGWEVPETEADFLDMADDPGAWETLCEDHKMIPA